MKCIHLSDLHLGKRFYGCDLLEDQAYILKEILHIIDQEAPDAVLIAGDVYDRSIPSAEAVSLFDWFLAQLGQRKQKTFVICGNHDSPQRLAFGGRLMAGSGIYMSPVYDGTVEPITLQDQYGPVDIYMLPFVKPANIRRFYPEEPTESYTQAITTAVRHMAADLSRRNILMTHQFVTGASRSESEEISVGGTDNVDASAFQGFDYVALGHIHGPQNAGGPYIRYCGTPLKYSFSEAKQEKSVTVVELLEKGKVSVRTIPLTPMRDMRELKGSYLELTARDAYEGTDREDYLHITLTDEEDIPYAVEKLRVIYPKLLKLDYDNTRTRSSAVLQLAEAQEALSPLELFSQLYEQQNGQPMSEEQKSFSQELMEKIWRDER